MFSTDVFTAIDDGLEAPKLGTAGVRSEDESPPRLTIPGTTLAFVGADKDVADGGLCKVMFASPGRLRMGDWWAAGSPKRGNSK